MLNSYSACTQESYSIQKTAGVMAKLIKSNASLHYLSDSPDEDLNDVHNLGHLGHLGHLGKRAAVLKFSKVIF